MSYIGVGNETTLGASEGFPVSVCCVLSCSGPAALVSRVLLPREKSVTGTVDTPDVEIPVGGISRGGLVW